MRRCIRCEHEGPSEDFPRASRYCKSCSQIRKLERGREANARWRAAHPETIKKRNKDFYDANQEREKARAQKWRLENPERCKETTAKWREENAERFKAMRDSWFEANAEYRKQYRREQYALNREEELAKARDWKAENKDICAALFMRRKAAKLRATPSWADQDAIKAIYAEARRLTEETGIKHHVDHIYPLQSDWVCGLHVETNLQILTASENHSKSNRRHPDHHPN